jgi:hypothetical protein
MLNTFIMNITKAQRKRENLDVDKFRNGDPIPEAKTDEEWYQATNNKEPVWCYYNNDPANGEKYGKLYNWFAVNDPRGLAPTGYHVPSDAEWTTLTNYLGGESVAGTKMKSTSGFSCLQGGFRSNDGTFYDIQWSWQCQSLLDFNRGKHERSCLVSRLGLQQWQYN